MGLGTHSQEGDDKGTGTRAGSRGAAADRPGSGNGEAVGAGARRMGVLCPSCGEKQLQQAGDEGGWVCPKYPKAREGSGCRRLYSREEYKDLCEEELEKAPALPPSKRKSGDSDGGKKRRALEDLERGRKREDVVEVANAEGADAEEGDGEPEEEEEEVAFDAMSSQHVKTTKATDALRVRREAVMGLLSISEVDQVLRGAFKPPRGVNEEDLQGIAGGCNRGKKLGVRLPLSSMNIKQKGFRLTESPPEDLASGPISSDDLDIEPLVLWDPVRDVDKKADGRVVPMVEGENAPPHKIQEYQHAFTRKNALVLDEYRTRKNLHPESVVVEPFLCKYLREHQRQGVQFMFECVTGQRDFDGHGCILADDMGLGKTFQSVTLLWTLLTRKIPLKLCASGKLIVPKKEGIGNKPTVKRVAVVCPTSLVKNWAAEIVKWLGDRLDGGVVAISESTREKVIDAINKYTMQNVYQREQKYPPVLIISYETFRIHHKRFGKNGPELIICDEAHRLKNDKTATTKSLASLPCRLRVLLSGTPMQNDLEEFFAMVDFTNPGVLGTCSEFRKRFQNPILNGREPDASDCQREKGQKAQTDLSSLVNNFILRRTNELLSKHLPPKVVQVVCCNMTSLQKDVYRSICQSKAVSKLMNDVEGKGGKMVLQCITSLKKLCNHPRLIHEAIVESKGKNSTLNDAAHCFPSGLFDGPKGAKMDPRAELSGKLAVLSKLLHIWYHEKKERCVLISNYTQTLQMFEDICRHNNYPFVRLDGSTGTGKRQKLVDTFNDKTQHQFAFLLSSKAGGCGLNLVGASRLVLFDPDWNPANDKQAGARIWRDGQNRLVFEYRFLSTGSIEEKVYQRQLSKEGLQGGLFESELQLSTVSSEELRNLFQLQEDTISDTYDKLQIEGPCRNEQIGKPAMEALGDWGHHEGSATVPDDALVKAGEGLVSFVFSNKVDGNEAKLLYK